MSMIIHARINFRLRRRTHSMSQYREFSLNRFRYERYVTSESSDGIRSMSREKSFSGKWGLEP